MATIVKPDFQYVSTETLRVWVGEIMTQLRTRKRGTNVPAPHVRPAAVVPSKPERAADTQTYLAKKAAYEARAFGVRRVSDGKELKRRCDTERDAQANALELSAKMKAQYVVFARS